MIDYYDQRGIDKWIANCLNMLNLDYGDFAIIKSFNQTKKYIYNGLKMETFENLPKQYRVLENNIPIDYWSELTDCVNIDIRPFREMMIARLQFNNKYEWYETKLDNYNVMFACEDNPDEIEIKLNKEDVITFDFDGEDLTI